jgi:hypothetical protein
VAQISLDLARHLNIRSVLKQGERMFSKYLTTSALGLCLAVAGSAAHAVPLTVDSGWRSFGWDDGLGLIDNPADGYQITSAVTFQIDITDARLIGDEFDVLVDSVVKLSTSAVALVDDGIQSGSFSGDSAWADERLSKGSLVVPAGTYQIDIDVTRTADGGRLDAGTGYIRATSDITVPLCRALHNGTQPSVPASSPRA